MTEIYLLAVFAVAYFIKESDIIAVPRAKLMSFYPKVFYPLFNCYFCLGFWSSLALYPIIYIYHIQDHFLYAFAGAAASFILSAAVQALQSFTYKDTQ